MTKKIYLESLKSVLGSSISHYCGALDVHVKFAQGLQLMLDTFNSSHQFCFSSNFISIFFWFTALLYIFDIGNRCYYYYLFLFFEVAIEGWTFGDLKPQPLNSVQTLEQTELSRHDFHSQSQPTLCNYSNFIYSYSNFICTVTRISFRVNIKQI